MEPYYKHVPIFCYRGKNIEISVACQKTELDNLIAHINERLLKSKKCDFWWCWVVIGFHNMLRVGFWYYHKSHNI